MDETSIQTIRKSVEEGGIVIMTAYSANVDEHNRLFDLTMQGRLSDVFGVRTSAFECPGTHFSNTNECGLQKRKLDLRRENPRIKFNGELLDFSIDYYEIVERLSAKASSK